MLTAEILTLEAAQKAGVLGTEPLPNARYLLAPLDVSPDAPPAFPQSPNPATEWVALVRRGEARETMFWSPDEMEYAWEAWGNVQTRIALGLPRLWGETAGNVWQPMQNAAAPNRKTTAFALAWELTALVSTGAVEGAREIAGYLRLAENRVVSRGWTLQPSETPEAAARRSERLVILKARFARSVEMRLVPQNRPFFAPHVWRTAYAVGMEWTLPHGGENRARFVWPARQNGNGLFFVGAGEAHGTLSPQKAASADTVPGLVFHFELPTAPAPMETFDRMVLALNYFAQTLNGRPLTTNGHELNAEALETMRDELEATVNEMARLGLAPGSPEAARFF